MSGRRQKLPVDWPTRDPSTVLEKTAPLDGRHDLREMTDGGNRSIVFPCRHPYRVGTNRADDLFHPGQGLGVSVIGDDHPRCPLEEVGRRVNGASVLAACHRVGTDKSWMP